MAAISRISIVRCLPFLTVLVGCESKVEADRRGVTVRDSLGIEIVESGAPLWVEATAWTIDPEPVLIIGDMEFDSTRALFQVNDVLLMDGDEVIVANGGTAELLWFDRGGNLKKVIGKPGRGPDELRVVRSVWRCENGAIAVNDIEKIVQFDTAGRTLASNRADQRIGDGARNISGIDHDCSRIVVAIRPAPRQTSVSDVVAPTWSLAWEDLVTGKRDTIARFPGGEVVGLIYQGRIRPQPFPWGNRPYWSTTQEGFTYVASSATYETRRYGPSGDLQRISRVNGRALPHNRPDRNVFEERRRLMVEAYPKSRTLDDILPKWGEFPVPEVEPVASQLIADDAGNVWIRSYPRSTGGYAGFEWDRLVEPESWTVFDPSGRWLGLVMIPSGVEVIRIQGDRLIGTQKDELDVEQVRVFRIRKPGAVLS